MNRRASLAAAAVFALSAGLFGPHSTAGADRPDLPPEDPARGLVYEGLTPARPDGPCAGGFVDGAGAGQVCTHGPDPAPPGVDVRRPRSVAELAAGTQDTPRGRAITCTGDGTGGPRVHAVYAVAGDRPDRYADIAPLIPTWAQKADTAFVDSAAETGGVRRVRWVTKPDCSLDVLKVVLTETGDDSLSTLRRDLYAQGFNRPDRKYLVWVDAAVMCGQGYIYADDRPGQENWNNGGTPAAVARVDTGCWGRVEAHELMHNLGGVQLSAPHTTGAFHCTDEYEIMCYPDGGNPIAVVCPQSHEPLFDCGQDDYYATNPAPGSYLATHWNTADSAWLTSEAPSPLARYHPVTPARILDTRFGTGAPSGKLGGGSTLQVQVAGQGGVPTLGVSAVVLNVTALTPTAAGYLTVWPSGLTRPVTSNLNFVPGVTVPNLVKVKVGAGGKVSIYNHAGETGVSADVAGWYGDATDATGSRYTPVTPARILDTRAGSGAPAAKVGPAGTIDLQVTGRGGVPASGVSAAVLQVTAIQPTAAGFLTAWPSGVARPLASNLNFEPGQVLSNLVIVKLGAGGTVSLYNHAGEVDLGADVLGWYGDDAALTGARYTALMPVRLLDTRNGLGAPPGMVGPGGLLDLQVTGLHGIPPAGVSAVVLNVTVVDPTSASFLTAWPSGEARPVAANLNFPAGQVVPSLVVVKVGSGGKISLYNHAGETHVAADVAGWFNAE